MPYEHIPLDRHSLELLPEADWVVSKTGPWVRGMVSPNGRVYRPTESETMYEGHDDMAQELCGGSCDDAMEAGWVRYGAVGDKVYIEGYNRTLMQRMVRIWQHEHPSISIGDLAAKQHYSSAREFLRGDDGEVVDLISSDIQEGWEDDLGIENPFPKEYVVTIIYDAEMSMKHRSSGPLDQVKHHAGWRVKRYGGAFNGGDRYDDRSEVSWLFTDYTTARAFAEDMNHFFFTPDVTDPEEYDEDEAQRAALGIDPETEAPFGQRIGVLDILVSIIDSESKESDVRSILSAQ